MIFLLIYRCCKADCNHRIFWSVIKFITAFLASPSQLSESVDFQFRPITDHPKTMWHKSANGRPLNSEKTLFVFVDLRPKGRGRPQRILLGQWPEVSYPHQQWRIIQNNLCPPPLGGHLTFRILSLLRYVVDIVKSSQNPIFF